jgi:hypothetical protein
VGTAELQLSGAAFERGEDTMGHYQVALSYLKAMWKVYTEVLGVTPRLDPFTPGQKIVLIMGDLRWRNTGSSVSEWPM